MTDDEKIQDSATRREILNAQPVPTTGRMLARDDGTVLAIPCMIERALQAGGGVVDPEVLARARHELDVLLGVEKMLRIASVDNYRMRKDLEEMTSRNERKDCWLRRWRVSCGWGVTEFQEGLAYVAGHELTAAIAGQEPPS